MSKELRSVVVRFTREGLEFAVTYSDDELVVTPGSKTRTISTARMASKALQRASEALEAALEVRVERSQESSCGAGSVPILGRPRT